MPPLSERTKTMIREVVAPCVIVLLFLSALALGSLVAPF